jgi:hypothetical protein
MAYEWKLIISYKLETIKRKEKKYFKPILKFDICMTLLLLNVVI